MLPWAIACLKSALYSKKYQACKCLSHRNDFIVVCLCAFPQLIPTVSNQHLLFQSIWRRHKSSKKIYDGFKKTLFEEDWSITPLSHLWEVSRSARICWILFSVKKNLLFYLTWSLKHHNGERESLREVGLNNTCPTTLESAVLMLFRKKVLFRKWSILFGGVWCYLTSCRFLCCPISYFNLKPFNMMTSFFT